jgi:anaphase-promoting complex subunit 1
MTIAELADSNKPKKEKDKAEPGDEMKVSPLTRIRFGTDRRLDEVSRMLQSTSPPTVKLDDNVIKSVPPGCFRR